MDSCSKKISQAKNSDESNKELIKEYNSNKIKLRFNRRYVYQNKIFSILDLLTSFFGLFVARSRNVSEPRRVIISNGGRLGDQIITARLIFWLKSKYPDTSFDILTQSSNIELHNTIKVFENVISLDHWYFSKNNRASSFIKYYLKSIWIAALKIRRGGYDLAIDLRYSYPNSALPIFLSAIPYSIGIKRVGLASLYSKALPHEHSGKNEFHYQKSVIESAGFNFNEECNEELILKPPDTAARRFFDDRYVIIHPCGSSETKDVPLPIWKSVIEKIQAYGYLCVITGAGDRDESFVRQLMLTNGGIVSLVGQLPLSKAINVVVGATLVISVDTFMGHLGAAFGRPVISLFGGFNDFMQWMPYGNNVSIITNPLDCSPCFQHRGCGHNLCIKGINEKIILDRLDNFFLNQVNQDYVRDKDDKSL